MELRCNCRSNASIDSIKNLWSEILNRSIRKIFLLVCNKIERSKTKWTVARSTKIWHKFAEFQGWEGQSASCYRFDVYLSFISLYRTNYSSKNNCNIPPPEDARGMSWLSFAMKTRNGYTWVMGGKVEQSIKKESWGRGE